MIKFLCTGDWHITAKSPKKRKDDYIKEQKRKIKFILELAKKEKCFGIIQPGDFYDHHLEPYWLIRKYIKLFTEKAIPIMTLFGQHDQRFHTVKTKNTPLGVTEVSPFVSLLNETPIQENNIAIYGADWSQEIPPISTPDAFNILVLHRMIVKDKLWDTQDEYEHGSHILRKNDFNLIISGDNHSLFTQKVGNKNLINCGSLMRSTIGQKTHQPTVFVVWINTNTKETIIQSVPIPIAPFDSVFDLEEKQNTEKHNEAINIFMDSLTTKNEFNDMDFYNNLMAFIEQENIPDPIKEIIQTTF